MGQLFYYLLLSGIVGPYLRAYPWLAALAVVVYLLRHRLPDPFVYSRTARRVRQLKIQIAQNADNAIARRDLALLWIERRRPRRAIVLLEEALRRDPESAELAFLLGLALVRSGRPDTALPHLVAAAGREPKLRYGEIFLVAGIAAAALGRSEEAQDALLRHLKINASSVEGWVRLARLRRGQGDADGARAALLAAVEAFDQSPPFRRRRELSWYVRAQLARVL